MKRYRIPLLIIILLGLLTACSTPTPTEAPLTAEPHETWQLLGWGVQGRFDELLIGTGNQWQEDYTDEAGNTARRWRGALWLSVKGCVAQRGKEVHIGDALDFAGYTIRVLNISDEDITLGLSGELADADQVAADCAASEEHQTPAP